MMRARFLIAAVLAAGVSLAAQSAPEIVYDANATALTLPNGTYFGEVAGVATNSRGHVFVYTRTGHPVATLGDERTFYHQGSRLFEFDQSGRFVKEIGQGTYAMNFAQQIRIDPQDNIWIVDAGSNQVVKFAADGTFRLVLGRKPESIPVRPGPGMPADGIVPTDNAPAGGGGRGGGRGGAPGSGINGDSFNRPSDVAWDAAGNIYVADGLGNNNRIAKFTPGGDFTATFGHTGSGPGEFRGVHGLAIDGNGNLYVADAGNNRIQVLDGQGKFRSEIKGVGTPQAICLTTGSPSYLYASNSNDPQSMDNGEIYKLRLDGTIAGKFGRAGKLPREFGITNSVDCRVENELWVGEIWNWRVQRVTLR
jgi:DNA-binding beta-propeller fold protein YncE